MLFLDDRASFESKHPPPRTHARTVWEHYNELAAAVDQTREREWVEALDTMLVFTGLFAAFLSAFIVNAMQNLQEDPTDVLKSTMLHLSLQMQNSSVGAFVPEPFTVSHSVAAVNILYFTSLSLVIITALVVMTVRSWIREFDRDWAHVTDAQKRGMEREARMQGLLRYKLPQIVSTLPFLIYVALFLFSTGLIVSLFTIHIPSACATLILLLCGFIFYSITTFISMLDPNAPFSSPLSRLLHQYARKVHAAWVLFLRAWAENKGIEPEQRFMRSFSMIFNGNNLQRHFAMKEEKDETKVYIGGLNRLLDGTVETQTHIPIFRSLLLEFSSRGMMMPNPRRWHRVLHLIKQNQSDEKQGSLLSLEHARCAAYIILSDSDVTVFAKHDQLWTLVAKMLERSDALDQALAALLKLRAFWEQKTWFDFTSAIFGFEPIPTSTERLIWIVEFLSIYGQSRFPSSVFMDVSNTVEVLVFVLLSTWGHGPSNLKLVRTVLRAMQTILGWTTGDREIELSASGKITDTAFCMETEPITLNPTVLSRIFSQAMSAKPRTLAHQLQRLIIPTILHTSGPFQDTLHPILNKGSVSDWGIALMDATRFQELQMRELEHVQRGDELLRVACAVILKDENPPLADRKELVLRLWQQYDATTKDAPTVLDEHSLQFMHWALDYLRKRRLFLGQFRPALQNPWLIFHLDNFFERDLTVPSDLPIPWSDNAAIHSIVDLRLELCEELAVVQPDYRLMSLFLQSTSFSICSRTFPHLVMHLSLTIQLSAIPIIKDGDCTAICEEKTAIDPQLESLTNILGHVVPTVLNAGLNWRWLRSLLLSTEQENKLLDGWLRVADPILAHWHRLPLLWRRRFMEEFIKPRGAEGLSGFQWLERVVELLLTRYEVPNGQFSCSRFGAQIKSASDLRRREEDFSKFVDEFATEWMGIPIPESKAGSEVHNLSAAIYSRRRLGLTDRSTERLDVSADSRSKLIPSLYEAELYKLKRGGTREPATDSPIKRDSLDEVQSQKVVETRGNLAGNTLGLEVEVQWTTGDQEETPTRRATVEELAWEDKREAEARDPKQEWETRLRQSVTLVMPFMVLLIELGEAMLNPDDALLIEGILHKLPVLPFQDFDRHLISRALARFKPLPETPDVREVVEVVE
jgi:hypothetical protein